MIYRYLFAIVCLLAASRVAAADEPSADGQRLARFLEKSDVEHLWLADRYVDWQTGQEIHPQHTKGHSKSSHCSAFVAAMCQKLDVDIARPPQFSEVFLSNKQHDWLSEEGKKHGWEVVTTADDAQAKANRGLLVVVSLKAKEEKKPGHIAIVLPWNRDARQIKEEGPEIIQAGQNNFPHTTVKEGFRHHKGAWPHGVEFFAHPVTLKD